jgi:hypothetical protein
MLVGLHMHSVNSSHHHGLTHGFGSPSPNRLNLSSFSSPRSTLSSKQSGASAMHMNGHNGPPRVHQSVLAMSSAKNRRRHTALSAGHDQGIYAETEEFGLPAFHSPDISAIGVGAMDEFAPAAL